MDVNELWESLARQRTLTPHFRNLLVAQYGERARKALLAIDEGRVKRYRDFFVVVGTSDEYVVEEDFCTCRDFIFRGAGCWHELAARIASITGGFEEVDLWYQDVWSGA